MLQYTLISRLAGHHHTQPSMALSWANKRQSMSHLSHLTLAASEQSHCLEPVD